MSEIANKQLYEELSQHELSAEEVLEAKQGFVGFFDLLYEIDTREEIPSE